VVDATIAAENLKVSPLSLVAVTVMKAHMHDGGGGEGVGLTREAGRCARLTASMLLLKLARLSHCLCW
jgi:hypothetical protein